MKKILLGFIVIGLISCSETKKDKYAEQAEKESSAIKAWAEKNTVKEDNSEIQKLKIGDKAHGGIIAYIDDTGEHGLVCSLEDLGNLNWDDAKKACENYVSVSGESDWYLPSRFELNILYVNLRKNGLGGFTNNFYWSSTDYDDLSAWGQNFASGLHLDYGKVFGNYVYTVRAF